MRKPKLPTKAEPDIPGEIVLRRSKKINAIPAAFLFSLGAYGIMILDQGGPLRFLLGIAPAFFIALILTIRSFGVFIKRWQIRILDNKISYRPGLGKVRNYNLEHIEYVEAMERSLGYRDTLYSFYVYSAGSLIFEFDSISCTGYEDFLKLLITKKVPIRIKESEKNKFEDRFKIKLNTDDKK